MSSPLPFASRRSISAQSSGEEQLMTFPVAFSTQRKAGMSSLEPSRIPAWLGAGPDPAGHVRHVAIANRPLEDGTGQTIDLQEDDPGGVGAGRTSLAPGDSPDHAQRVRVVVVGAEDDLEHEHRRRDEHGGNERPAE